MMKSVARTLARLMAPGGISPSSRFPAFRPRMQHKEGKRRFILTTGAVFTAVALVLLLAFDTGLFDYPLVTIPVWCLAGLLFGVVMWHFNNALYEIETDAVHRHKTAGTPS